MDMMKKILGALIVLAALLVGGIAFAAVSQGGTFDSPVGGTCGATPDCAAGLSCGSGGVCVSSASGGATAQSGGSTAPLARGQLQNPIKYDNFYDFVAAVLETAVEILMPFVVLAFIWSGFLFVRAQGAPAELEKAKSAIYWSIIGAFILMGAWGFAQIISTTISTLTQ
ncbi:MAG: hypothetical protein A2937_00720 [Candidatus Yonathbacteria bacterium RIFCSPLOWO2_01_FULL_47_33b]|uniref:Uncharacterized protein n=1 Tax=Candidatus Yonathbacteria bacterium RIFCSPLOWO2_01_FULL_47_33b TaxID=1802727 RepID=A0A1G2SEB0_9BACT|nr:MAG: hypothetical protein A2937_00720 [Candidatus Yonathbacteria bacterium RIFCSPLOWO2_01_FULL_47_33b]